MAVQFLDPKTNPFQTSEIRRIQDFYGASYEDLWDKDKLKELWLKAEEIKYCLENKDKEFALKSTEWFELREWVTTTKRFIELQEFYGFTLQDTQDISKLEELGLKDEDIDFITGRELEKTEEVKTEEVKIETKPKAKWVKKQTNKNK